VSFFRDPDFQEKLVAFICRDRNFLHDCAHLLEPDDFKPRKPGDPMEIWVIASKGLEFYRKYREPIAGMLRTEILDHCRKTNAGEKQKARMLELADRIKTGHKLVAVEALAEKVIEYKKERLKKKSIQELVDLQEQGKLTDDRWMEKCYEAIKTFGKLNYEVSDYFEGLEERIARRENKTSSHKYPYFLIDPLDELIKGPGRGHVALFLAYLGMGKSVALNWMATSYVLQGLNVLYFTLEDPLEEVENRFDAMISMIATSELIERAPRLRIRFARFLKMLRTRIRIIDGTDGGYSVARMEEIWDRERNRGFTADAIIIDYDDEIKPPRKQEERRFEFADIYRELRQLAARRQVILWTAAQSGRKASTKKIITTDSTAEDISKARKARLVIGIGKGDWGDDSRYLYVAKNNFGRQFVGRNVMGDFDATVFYDREATMKAIDKVKEEKDKEKVREV
jgi:replicative DNA helicase